MAAPFKTKGFHDRATRYTVRRVKQTAAGSSAAIEFRGVMFSRGTRSILSELELVVEHGETLALVGRSGAGKSTILKLINGLLRQHGGEVIVLGRPVWEWNLYELRRSAGYVLQEVGLFPHLSIAANVAVVPRLVGWDESRIDARVTELLDLVGLPPAEFAGRFPHQLSGGQRQRVGVARALAADPPILLMDEPFGALDPVTRSDLHREFRRIQQRLSRTVVLVTHDMVEALALGTRVGVIADGRVAAIDTPQAMVRSDDARVRPLLEPLHEAGALLRSAR
jgi:osmoprotectant transport system ATP-binding protein